MGIDSLVVGIIVVVAIAVAVLASQHLAKRTAKQAIARQEQEAREAEERARDEKRQREEWLRQEQARKAEERAIAEAHERKIVATMESERAQQAFLETHDKLIAAIRQKAREGCDEAFRQRFGVTRPPKADSPENDSEVQDFLRENYAKLRDAAIDEATEALIQGEVERRSPTPPEDEAQPASNPDVEPVEGKAAEAEAEATGAEATRAKAAEGEAESNDSETTVEAQSADADAAGAEVATAETLEAEAEAAESEPKSNGAETRTGEDEDDAPIPEDAETADEAIENPDPRTRGEIEAEVREHFDADSIRTYLLAAISARFAPSGKPIGELPWPAYTTVSPLGFGELRLVKGAPIYAQDAYRSFAWKKFHTGKRAEKPVRGEYSWPETHELGDADAGTGVRTPAGTFSVHAVSGPLPLRELENCTWVRHDLEHQDSLLVPDEQHSLLVSLEGLLKGNRLELRFDSEDAFLEAADDSDFTLNAVGRAGEAFVGISVSNPEAAGPGEGPYELTARDGYGFTFQMTADARRHDDDTYPQFIQVNLAWCQPPSLHPEKIVRHVTH